MSEPINDSSLINAAACKRKLIQEARDAAYHWVLVGESLRVSKETLEKIERATLTAIRQHVSGLQKKGKTL